MRRVAATRSPFSESRATARKLLAATELCLVGDHGAGEDGNFRGAAEIRLVVGPV
jgi:hypothetical protein